MGGDSKAPEDTPGARDSARRQTPLAVAAHVLQAPAASREETATADGREGPEVRPGPGGSRRSGGRRCEPTAPEAGARGDGSLRPDSRSRGPGFPPPLAEARGVKTEGLPPWGVRQSPAASLRITPWLSIVSFPIVMREHQSRLKRILEEDAAPGHAPLSPRAGSVFHRAPSRNRALGRRPAPAPRGGHASVPALTPRPPSRCPPSRCPAGSRSLIRSYPAFLALAVFGFQKHLGRVPFISWSPRPASPLTCCSTTILTRATGAAEGTVPMSAWLPVRSRCLHRPVTYRDEESCPRLTDEDPT